MDQEDREVWQHIEDKNQNYYTPYANFRNYYTSIGDVSSPAEKCEYLNNNPKSQYDREGIFRTSSKNVMTPGRELPDGVYRFQTEAYTPCGDLPDRFVPINVRDDSYITLAGPFESIKTDINKFISNKEFYYTRKFMYKLGILMYGSPGNGKTMFIRQVIDQLIPKDSITIFIPELPQQSFLDKVRSSLKGRLKVFVFEELAAATSEKYDVEQLLDFLDGEASIADSIILATTNYPEKIPKNVIDRASRFDKIYEIGCPKGQELKTLLEFFLQKPVTEAELQKAKNLSIADIKEISFLVELYGKTFEEGVKVMADRHKICEKAFARSFNVGFGE